MSSDEQVKGSHGGNKAADATFDAFTKIFSTAFRILWFGIKNFPIKYPATYSIAITLLLLLYLVVTHGWHLTWLHELFPRVFTYTIILKLWALGPLFHYLTLLGYLIFIALVCLGIKPFCDWKKLQRAIDCVNLKSGSGLMPKLTSIRTDGNYRQRLLLLSQGVGIDRYETRRADLESSFGAIIEHIRHAKNPQYIEIALAKRQIPKKCLYRDLISMASKPYSFVVGESLGGSLIQGIRELPHMIIAGTTGGGKSVFFKQAILGLAQSSPYIQMYLLDLKNGVEMKEFGMLPHVVVAKNEREAVHTLQRINAEMDRRFQYMEAHGYKKIEPERDKMDLILVGIDEASVLYTKSNRRSSDSHLIEEARELTDRLAKLARAAAIHLIFATQKVSKETIDTKIQENIGGRMCFRMNTLQGSLTVLGNKMAFELPDHPGRAIWASGNKFIEVQAPLIAEDEINREVEVIKFEFENGKRKNFQPMLTTLNNKKLSGPDITEVLAS